MRIVAWLIERSLPFVFSQFFDSGPVERGRPDSWVSIFRWEREFTRGIDYIPGNSRCTTMVLDLG